MKLAAVLVHFHTAELAARACDALLADLTAAGFTAELLVVDNGSTAAEREVLRSLPARLLEPGANLGYAGGANLGVRSSDAETLIVLNPDVEVLPGCVAALVEALEGGAATAGPRFFWDADRRFLLPPTELRTRRAELFQVLGTHHTLWARLGRRRWRRHAWRFWTASEPYRCHELSGALLAFPRRVFEELGGFDDAYRLYFEETDWLERLRRRGLEARFVPRAEAVHLYARSTVSEPRAAGWFAESHRRFRRRFYGGAFTALVERLATRQPRPRPPVSRVRPAERGAAAWLELSASPQGYPAAGRRLGAGTSLALPDELLSRLEPGAYFARTVAASGRELEAWEVTFGPQKRSPSPIV